MKPTPKLLRLGYGYSHKRGKCALKEEWEFSYGLAV